MWRSTFDRYVNPLIGSKPVSEITTADVLRVLESVHRRFPKSVPTIRKRMGVVFNRAVAAGLRTDNPAAAAVISDVLGPRPDVTHHRALPHAQVADALARVRACHAWIGTRLMFEFMVLTGVRTNEARGASWTEIDFAAATWVIPMQRMKERVQHEVPLSTCALAVLESAHTSPELRAARARGGCTDLVFPTKRGRPLYNNALSKLLSDLGIPAVPHGFRSSFRDWCGETGVAFEVAETALSHAVGNQVTRAYSRSDLFKRRIRVMQDWGKHVTAADDATRQKGT